MPRIELADQVGEAIRELPHDPVLLAGVWRQFERIADDVVGETEPAKCPYRSDRLMSNFALNDSDGFRWNAVVTLDATNDSVRIRTFSASCVNYEGEIERDRD